MKLGGPIYASITNAWGQPPELCRVGMDGKVVWTESASPEAIMKMSRWNGPLATATLALWYATGGKNT